MIRPRSQKFSIISIVIHFKTIDHFFSNQDLFSTYTEYEHKFKIGLGEKITALGYSNINLRMSNLKGNINTLTVINISWVPKLDHNLLNIIPLVWKGVEVLLRKAGQPSKNIINDKVFGLTNIIKTSKK